jgi:hypothetical protein
MSYITIPTLVPDTGLLVALRATVAAVGQTGSGNWYVNLKLATSRQSRNGQPISFPVKVWISPNSPLAAVAGSLEKGTVVEICGLAEPRYERRQQTQQDNRSAQGPDWSVTIHFTEIFSLGPADTQDSAETVSNPKSEQPAQAEQSAQATGRPTAQAESRPPRKPTRPESSRVVQSPNWSDGLQDSEVDLSDLGDPFADMVTEPQE